MRRFRAAQIWQDRRSVPGICVCILFTITSSSFDRRDSLF